MYFTKLPMRTALVAIQDMVNAVVAEENTTPPVLAGIILGPGNTAPAVPDTFDAPTLDGILPGNVTLSCVATPELVIFNTNCPLNVTLSPTRDQFMTELVILLTFIVNVVVKPVVEPEDIITPAGPV